MFSSASLIFLSLSVKRFLHCSFSRFIMRIICFHTVLKSPACPFPFFVSLRNSWNSSRSSSAPDTICFQEALLRSFNFPASRLWSAEIFSSLSSLIFSLSSISEVTVRPLEIILGCGWLKEPHTGQGSFSLSSCARIPAWASRKL